MLWNSFKASFLRQDWARTSMMTFRLVSAISRAETVIISTSLRVLSARINILFAEEEIVLSFGLTGA